MPTFNFMGTDMYIQTRPTFRGSKAPVIKKVPYTARTPSPAQWKARAWLARTALSHTNTFGTTGDTGHGKAGPKIAREIFNKKPGKGAHGGKATLRDYAIARRKGEAAVRELERLAAVVAPA